MPAASIARPSLGYRLTRRVARVLLRMEYRRVETSGAERAPTSGAVLFVANHHNSLVDSMAILAASPRPAGPMAKAPLWHSRILRPFLDAVEAVPVYRPQDVSENEGRGARANLETFAECIRRLRDGRSLVLFPEGMSRPSSKLMPLRTGAARIALDAELPVHVMPVGLQYEPPAARRGTLLVRFGEPFIVDGRTPAPTLAAVESASEPSAGGAAPSPRPPRDGESRHGRVSTTTRRIETAIRALLAEADSLEDVGLLRVAAAVEAQESGAGDESLEARHVRVQRLAAGFEALRRVDPAEREGIRAEGAAFARHLALLEIPLDLLDSRYSLRRVARFLGGTLVRLVIGAPMALVAAIVTAPARLAGDLLSLRGGLATEDVLPFARILGRTLFLAIETLLAAAALAFFVSPLAGLTALVLLPALYVVHILWRDWRADVGRRVRAFLLLAGGRLRKELRAERKALADRIAAAGRRITEGTRGPRTP